MSRDEISPEVSPEGPRPASHQKGRWRLVLTLGALTALGFVLLKGSEKPPAEEPALPDSTPIHIPLPKTPHRDLLEEARGIYVLETERATFNLELQRAGQFRFLSRFSGKENRIATGTWNLVGQRLTMSYREIEGNPVQEETIVKNVYRGDSVELQDTGLDFPVVLTKRTMLRER